MKSTHVYFCSHIGCGKAFSKPSRLLQHARTHTGERPYRCTVFGCSRSYARAAHLTRHVKNSHSAATQSSATISGSLTKPLRVYSCPVVDCGRTFKKKNSYYYHKLTHEGKKNFVCAHDGCGKAFVFPSKLRRHEKTHQGYRCTVVMTRGADEAEGEQQRCQAACGSTFSTWSALAAHRRAAHRTLSRRRFACTTCGKTFTRRFHLNEHLETHADTRTIFICPRGGCERRFFYLRNFVVHLRSVHLVGELLRKHPLNPCPSCEKMFATLSGLRRHLDVHARQSNVVVKRFPRKGHRKISDRVRLVGRPELSASRQHSVLGHPHLLLDKTQCNDRHSSCGFASENCQPNSSSGRHGSDGCDILPLTSTDLSDCIAAVARTAAAGGSYADK